MFVFVLFLKKKNDFKRWLVSLLIISGLFSTVTTVLLFFNTQYVQNFVIIFLICVGLCVCVCTYVCAYVHACVCVFSQSAHSTNHPTNQTINQPTFNSSMLTHFAVCCQIINNYGGQLCGHYPSKIVVLDYERPTTSNVDNRYRVVEQNLIQQGDPD